jgi:hypothetical protein
MNKHFNRIALGMAAWLAGGQVFAQTVSYDITADNSSAMVDGAYFFQKTGTTASGTGTFNTFLGVKDDEGGGDPSGPTQGAGFNAPVVTNPMGLEVDESKTFEIYGIDLVAPDAVGGAASGDFFQMGLDINEPNGGNQDYLSIDEFEIWVRAPISGSINPANDYTDLSTSGATKVYELDVDSTRDVTLLAKAVDAAGGSGNSDYLILVPQSKFTDVPGWNENWLVFVWIMVGGAGDLGGLKYGEDSGFEELGNVSGYSLTVPPPVPEAGTFAAVVVLATAVLGRRHLRRRSKTAR